MLLTAAAGALLWPRPPGWGLALIVLAVVGLPFLWNPHVTPVHLWGVRRFVPVVVPWLGLLAANVPAWVAGRSRWLAVALGGLLVAANARPMTRLYGLPFFPSQTNALAELAEKLPANAVVLVAPELTAYLVHLPLWMVHDREPLVLSPVRGQTIVPAVIARLAARHHVVLLANSLGPQPVIDKLDVRPRADVTLRTLTPELDPLRAPTRGTAHLVPLRVYDLTPRPPG